MLTTRHDGGVPAPGSALSRGAGQLAAFLLASCTASGATTYKSLPAIVWEGERLRFATTVGRLPCGDSLEYMDRRVDELTAVLDHPIHLKSECPSKDKLLPCRDFFNKKPPTGAIVAAYLLHKSGGDLLKTF